MNANRMILGVVSAFLVTFFGVALAKMEGQPTRTLDVSETAKLFGGQPTPLNGLCPYTDPTCNVQPYASTPCGDLNYPSNACSNWSYQFSLGKSLNCFKSDIKDTSCSSSGAQTSPCLGQLGCSYDPDKNGGTGGCSNGSGVGTVVWKVPSQLTITTNCSGPPS